ncbi:MAG TPA: hypothetical protein VE870_10830, partial [Bacteroidales bacterium]|nr:hypothetical protein [Bacteroidales bacterium]
MSQIIMKTARTILLSVLAVAISAPSLYGQANDPGEAESLFVTTDRDIYFAGENIWLSTVCLDGQDRIKTGSKTVYLELLTTGNQVVTQSMILTSHGKGSGKITVPAFLSSGFYLLRAYTNYMKNFGTGSFYYKKLMLLNPVQGGRFNYTVTDTSLVQATDIKVFAEGGAIYQNLYNRVYVYFDKSLPKPAMKGWVVSQYYDTLANLNFIKNNLAWFDLVPGTPKYYLSLPGMEQWFPLNIDRNKASLLNVQASFDRYALSLESSDSVVKASSLFLEIRPLNHASKKTVSRPFTSPLILDASILEEGFSSLNLVDSNGDTVATNYLYKRPGGNLKVSIGSGADTYNTREKASVSIETYDASGNPVSSIVSVSVRKKTATAVRNATLPDFLAIPEDFKAIAADWNLTNMTEASAFLTIYGKDMFSGKTTHDTNNYEADKSGIIVRGKLENAGKPLPGATVYLSVVGDSALIYPDVTTAGGR